jgi:hypothetical protein
LQGKCQRFKSAYLHILINTIFIFKKLRACEGFLGI